MEINETEVLICNCGETMPLDPKKIDKWIKSNPGEANEFVDSLQKNYGPSIEKPQSITNPIGNAITQSWNWLTGGSTQKDNVQQKKNIPQPNQYTTDKNGLLVRKDAEKQMISAIDEAKSNGDSVGGIFEIIATGCPYGLGSPFQWDRKLQAKISAMMMSVNAFKSMQDLSPMALRVDSFPTKIFSLKLVLNFAGLNFRTLSSVGKSNLTHSSYPPSNTEIFSNPNTKSIHQIRVAH